MIEIRYAPGGDEKGDKKTLCAIVTLLRLDMPREGKKRNFKL